MVRPAVAAVAVAVLQAVAVAEAGSPRKRSRRASPHRRSHRRRRRSRAAFFEPSVAGSNATDTVQLAAGGAVTPLRPSASVTKSAAEAPASVRAESCKSTGPVFSTVTV